MTEVEHIAAGLTEAQRNALFHLSGYHDPNAIKSLRRKGLYERGLLTELGVSVAAHLKEHPDA